jgi:hypothetical protein
MAAPPRRRATRDTAPVGAAGLLGRRRRSPASPAILASPGVASRRPPRPGSLAGRWCAVHDTRNARDRSVARARVGKSDPIDAVEAARAARTSRDGDRVEQAAPTASSVTLWNGACRVPVPVDKHPTTQVLRTESDRHGTNEPNHQPRHAGGPCNSQLTVSLARMCGGWCDAWGFRERS